MPDRKHLTVHPTIYEIVEREVKARNRFPKPGERKCTNQSLTEEIILYWEKVKKESSK